MSQDESCVRRSASALILAGSNLPTRFHAPSQLCLAGLERLESDAVQIVAASRIYATPCMPAGAGPDYANAVVRVATSLNPHVLLSSLHEVEEEFDRKRKNRWGARTLDLDLLDYDGQTLPNVNNWWAWHDLPREMQSQKAPSELVLPHPRIQDRAFVLVPLCEIAPNWQHPVLGQSAAGLCDALPESERRSIVSLDSAESLALSAKGR